MVSVTMKLLPLDTPDLIELVARWLAGKENYQWLDFGGGRQVVTPALLKVMTQRAAHFLRVYTTDEGEPIGIAGLNGVERAFRTATLWGATGEKSFRSRGYATYAGSQFLTLAFRELGLHAINTWVVEHNPSLRLVQRLGFRLVGRQRQCHYIDGQAYDRLLFDLLASEHQELECERPRRLGLAATDTVQEEDRTAHV
jgi:RimJ/RimL family protein N-acetyltransferase